MKTDALIEELAASPKLPFVIDALKGVLDAERPLRAKFYDEITEDGKVEFINGKVIVQSPAKLKHIKITGWLGKLLETFVSLHNLGVVTHEKALICLTRNDYEPDLCFFGPAKATKLKLDQLKFPPPDWVCEILSDSTEKTERGVKYEDYALHGIREYWIIDAKREELEVHLLTGKSYRLAQTLQSGTVESLVIPAFKIPVRALFDAQEANKTLKEMLR